jgi:deazaflavin-dependent oxidoreductase (nitroreductase family)
MQKAALPPLMLGFAQRRRELSTGGDARTSSKVGATLRSRSDARPGRGVTLRRNETIAAMQPAERNHNPFINSPAGGRALSALQLPIFLMRPPRGYAVLMTTGRKTGKVRRRCVRAIRQGDLVYVVAIKGTTQWAMNALANPAVRLRLPRGSVSGLAREVSGAAESQVAKEAYCESVHGFDYLTWINWRKGRPTRGRIEELLRGWFDEGTPLVVELRT